MSEESTGKRDERSRLSRKTKTRNPRSSTRITGVSILLRKKTEEVLNGAIDKEQALIAQINLNSKFQYQKKSDRQSSAPQENNAPENFLGSLLQSGIAGGKIERSRQILKAIQKTDRVSIDENNLNIFLDQQDTSENITDFLTALQVNTKHLLKQFLNLVEIIASPQFLLANFHARQTSSKLQNRSIHGESPCKRIKLDTDVPNS